MQRCGGKPGVFIHCPLESPPMPASPATMRLHPLRTCWIALACLFVVPCALAGTPARYVLDPVHTRVLFAIDHAGFSHALGTVSGTQGELWFDPDDWSSARLRATVPMTRVDLGDEKWTRAAQASNLLATQRYPQATFVSTRIVPVDATHAAVYGTLTLHGVAQDVQLDVTLNAAKRDPIPPFRRTVGFSATTTLSRKAFGIDAWPSMIGDAVELRLEVEATRARGGADDALQDGLPQDGLPQDGARQDDMPQTAAPAPAAAADVDAAPAAATAP